MSKNSRAKISDHTIAMTYAGMSEIKRRKCGDEKLCTVFVRAVDPAKALTDDMRIRGLIGISGGKIEKTLPFADGACQYQVNIPACRYDALKEGWPLFEARLDKPYEGPSRLSPLQKCLL
jgi:hypothetical protein